MRKRPAKASSQGHPPYRSAASSRPESESKSFPIVGIGASAGGFEAFTQLLEHLPLDTGMAFVLVQHLDPTHESKLTELLSRATRMPVVEVREEMTLRPNHVYVMPPNKNMTISGGVLHLLPRKQNSGHHAPIDYFLRSLAGDRGARAIGVILSGSGTDGTLGLKAIKAEGGVTFAQDEESAKYNAMPRSAMAAGCVDFAMPTQDIARELAHIARHPAVHKTPLDPSEQLLTPEGDLAKIFALLRAYHGVDFTFYKHNTLRRRITRRMVVQKVEQLAKYVKLLQKNPAEVEALFNDILINVTSFFRDGRVFQALKKQIFPRILKNNNADSPIRIWVPGCSTGEEVYSLTISLMEFLTDNKSQIPLQVFATDISEAAIARARAGIYPENIAQEVSPERLRRFFTKQDGACQISKAIRDTCVFARQDVTQDPPFSKLDLISCRNLLIYLGPTLQKKVMPILHYALKSTGFLLLGSSETVGGFADSFELLDKKNKIYTKKTTYGDPPMDFSRISPYKESPEPNKSLPPAIVSGPPDLIRQADRIILSRFAPAGVVINRSLEVLHFCGHTGPYLEHAAGEATLNVLKMGREGLALDLRTLISKAIKQDAHVKKEAVRFHDDGQSKQVSIEVLPFSVPRSTERFFLVMFHPVSASRLREAEESRSSTRSSSKASQRKAQRELERVREELASTKESLQAIIEAQETTYGELKSANEEIQSSNEELQSTNEELETAKEELQSTNEELTTLNEELQNRNGELSHVNDDLSNLISSTNIPILMLDHDLKIRRFTPMGEKMFNLIPGDVGRQITDIKSNLECPNFDQLVAQVVETLAVREVECQDREGRWFSLRIRPYRTKDNKIDGAVVTLVDVDDVKRSLEQVLDLVEYPPLLVLQSDLRIRKANRAFYRTFDVTQEETENKFIYDLGDGQWNIPKLRTLLENILPRNGIVDNFEVVHNFPQLGRRTMLLNGRRIHLEGKGAQLILLAIADMTGPTKND